MPRRHSRLVLSPHLPNMAGELQKELQELRDALEDAEEEARLAKE